MFGWLFCGRFSAFCGLYWVEQWAIVDSRCINCWNNSNYCELCDRPYGSQSGACSLCQDSNCDSCGPDWSVCLQCKPEYGLNVAVCTPCNVVGCFDCLANYLTCVSCKPGLGMSSGACVDCTDTQCAKCPTSATSCTECNPGFGTDGLGGPCSSCSASCTTCSFTDFNTCTGCPDGFFLNSGSCMACPINCALCSNGSFCEQCSINFYANATASCVSCPADCIQCFYNLNYSTPECVNCSVGFELDNHVPPTCREYCGDGVTSVHPCDNQLDQPYDGCNNDCAVETDFTCTVTAGATVCSFNGNLQMTFVKVEREKDTDKFTLVIHVFPPLYAFKITSDSELQKIFVINNVNMQVNKVSYDPLTQNLKFQGEVLDTIPEGEKIQVVFMPSLGSSPEYSASIPAAVSITLPRTLYFFSSFTMGLAKIIPFICYALSFLGWATLILGIILRRLAGLEAFMVLQFSFLTLMWIPCQLLYLFEQTNPLRYTTGYNYPFLSQNSTQSSASPYLSQFKMSQSYFANNFNFPIPLIIAALIAVIITTVRYKKFLRNYEENNNTKTELVAEQEEQQKLLEKLMGQNETAYTCFMYTCMAFLVYFSMCSLIFFKYGTLSNILSISLFSLTILFYGFNFVQLAIDPCSFTYFRFSFRPTVFALNHYFIHIIILLSATVLLGALSNFPWIGIGPCLLMLVYTLAYRPYKQLKENLRSAFNYLTISSFLGFLLYVQMSPKASLGSTTTALFLLINIVILLLIVLILSFISSIYYYYYENYILPKEEQNLKNTKDEVIKKKRRNVLRELGMISARKNMQAVEEDTTFRQIVSPMNNLKNVSNALHDQFLKQQKARLELAKGPLDRTPLQQGKNNDYGRYKDIIKLEMLNKGKTEVKDDGIIHTFDDENTSKNEKEWKEEQRLKEMQKQALENQIPTQQEIARKILVQENKFVNLRGAIQYVKEEMDKPADKNEDRFLEEFDKIRI